MPITFLQRGQTYAAHMLHRAGLTVSQIPQAVHIARETVEGWLQKELEKGNAHQVLQVLKGQLQEKGPKLLYDRLTDLLILRLLLHLGLRGALATNIATLLLPFVLKRVYTMVAEHPKTQSWWQQQEWRNRMPTVEEVKTRLQEVSQQLAKTRFKRFRKA